MQMTPDIISHKVRKVTSTIRRTQLLLWFLARPSLHPFTFLQNVFITCLCPFFLQQYYTEGRYSLASFHQSPAKKSVAAIATHQERTYGEEGGLNTITSEVRELSPSKKSRACSYLTYLTPWLIRTSYSFLRTLKEDAARTQAFQTNQPCAVRVWLRETSLFCHI